MTPALLFPLALTALAALAIPIVIHIARRTESSVIDFAALRWLTPSPRPRRRPRIDERRLLLVRLLLLGALVLWLARPVLWGADDARPVIAVAPGVDPAPIIEAAPREARLVWLAPGFPSLDSPTPEAADTAVSLIRQLDAELPPDASLDIVVPPVLENADAERPRLTRAVNWRVADQSITGDQPVRATVPALTLRHSAEAEGSVRYFSAAATAWAPPQAQPDLTVADVDAPVESDTRHLIWLAAGPLPQAVVDWIEDGGVALLSHDARLDLEGEPATVWSDAAGRPLATAGRRGLGRVIQFTLPLEPSSLPQLLDADFPDELERLLVPPVAPTRVAAADHAPLTSSRAYVLPPWDIRPWLALLIALLFATERWLATSSRRSVAP